MKNILLISSILFFNCSVLFSQTPYWDWAQVDGDIEEGTSMASDAGGNIYVTGFFKSSTLTFGSITVTNNSPSLTSDIVIVKYNSAGNVIWAKSAGGSNDELSKGITTDASGNIYVTGHFRSTGILFGNDTLTNTTMNSNRDIFIFKFDSSGNEIWGKSVGGTNEDESQSIKCDSNGNIFIAGNSKSPLIFFGNDTLYNSGNNDVFIAKYNSSGNRIWAKAAGGTMDDFATGITTDASGNSYVTGYYKSSSVIFGNDTLINSGMYDIFIAKYDSSGNSVWAKRAAGTDTDIANGIASYGSGSIYITGYFRSTAITFGTTILTTAGFNDFFIAKYDFSGNVLWVKKAGGTGGESGFGISCDLTGNVYATGFISSSSVNFGTTILTATGACVFAAKYDSSGNALYAISTTGTAGWSEKGSAIVTDANANAYVTGLFLSPSITFGNITLNNPGGANSSFFIAKVGTLTTEVEKLTKGAYLITYPNPLTNATSISFSISHSQKVSLKILDVNGRLVSTLADEILNEGENRFVWNADGVKAGIYFLKM